MLHDIIASSTGGEPILVLIEYAALAIEILAVLIIIVAIIHAVLRYTFRTLLDSQGEDPYQELKVHLGKALLLVTTVEIYIERYSEEDGQRLESTLRERFKNGDDADAASSDDIDLSDEKV